MTSTIPIMKKAILIVSLLCMLCPVASAQSSEPADTVKYIKKAKNITVTRLGDTTEIRAEINGTPADTFLYSVNVSPVEDFDFNLGELSIDIPFKGISDDAQDIRKDRRGKRRIRTSLIPFNSGYFGQRFNYYDKGFVKNSYEVGFRNIFGIRWDHGYATPSFSIGVGIGAQRYDTQRGYVFAKDGSRLIIVPVAEGNEKGGSTLEVLNLQIPLMMSLPIGNHLYFQIGTIATFNTFAKAHAELKRENSKIKSNYKDLQQRLFTPELYCSFGIKNWIGVYASWSPVTLFQAPYGPQLKSWSIGASFNF